MENWYGQQQAHIDQRLEGARGESKALAVRSTEHCADADQPDFAYMEAYGRKVVRERLVRYLAYRAAV